MTATLSHDRLAELCGVPPAPPDLIDVQAVAAKLTCSTRHARRLADSGKMPPPIKLGNLLRWRRADIDDWIAGGCKAVRTAGRPAR
jgi:predicted DNA-binding transcriptional regulator AlpA